MHVGIFFLRTKIRAINSHQYDEKRAHFQIGMLFSEFGLYKETGPSYTVGCLPSKMEITNRQTNGVNQRTNSNTPILKMNPYIEITIRIIEITIKIIVY